MQAAPVKKVVPWEIFDRVDIRVGTIERVDDISGADKLLRLTVNLGDHTRTVVAGMKQERDDPGEIEGEQALFVVNLEPREIMGVISEGMLLDIGYSDGITPVLAQPERRVPDGARAG